MKSHLIATAILATTLALPAAALEPSPSYFPFHIDSPMRLGKGFLQNDLSYIPPQDCVTFTRGKGAGAGSPRTEFELIAVSDYTSLLEQVTASAHVNAHFLVGSVDARFSQERQSFSSGRNVVVIFRAYSEFPQEVAVDLQLKSEFAAMLAAGRIDEFKQQCGARVPVSEKRGVSVSAVITLYDVSSDLRSALNASMSGGASFGIVKGSASHKLKTEFTEIAKSNRYSVQVVASGGNGIADATDLIRGVVREKTSLDALGDAVAAYVKDFNQTNAAALGFFVTDMPNLASVQADPWSIEKQNHLSRLAGEHRQLADKRNILAAIISHVDPRYRKFSPDQMAQIKAQHGRVEAAVQAVVSSHGSCKAALPPALAPCQERTDLIRAALEESIPDALRAPRGRFALSVGEKDTFKVLGDDTVHQVFASPAAINPTGYVEWEIPEAPISYRARLTQRLASVVGAAENPVLRYEVDAPDLASIEAFVEAGPELVFPAGYAGQRYSDRSWSAATLPNLEARWDDGKQQVEGRAIRLGQVAKPSLTQVEESDVVPEAAMAARTLEWVKTGVQTGTGRYALRVADLYGGSAEFDLLAWKWDTDEALGIVKIDYVMATGEPADRLFLVGLKPASSRFPLIHVNTRWEAPARLSQYPKATHTLPFPATKWNVMTGHVCGYNSTHSPSMGKAYRVQIDRNHRDHSLDLSAWVETQKQHHLICSVLGVGPKCDGTATISVQVQGVYLVRTLPPDKAGPEWSSGLDTCPGTEKLSFEERLRKGGLSVFGSGIRLKSSPQGDSQ